MGDEEMEASSEEIEGRRGGCVSCAVVNGVVRGEVGWRVVGFWSSVAFESNPNPNVNFGFTSTVLTILHCSGMSHTYREKIRYGIMYGVIRYKI